MTVSRVTTLVAFLVATILPLRAQQTTPAPNPVFRGAVSLVPVDALVTDGQGNVVTGLTAKDFQITEKGRPQAIAAFTFVSTPLVERREFDPVPAGPVRDVVTNRIAPHSRAYAIVIDDLHLLEMHGERIRRVLTDLLGSIPATDRVAVVFTGRSDLSVDLTDDRATQLQAVARVREALGFALDPAPVACGAKEAQRKQQALGTLEVLRNVSSVLAQTQADERSVVFLSEGLNYDFGAAPIGPVDLALNQQKKDAIAEQFERFCDANGLTKPQQSKTALPDDPQENPADAGLVRISLQNIFESARKADVRIYTIDPRGNLTADAESRGDVPARGLASKLTVQHDFLRSVASETDGLAAVQNSDMHWAVHRVLADTSSYYLLGYSPTPAPTDGLFHEIEVKVLRPGLHVRARAGYSAAELAAAASSESHTIGARLVAADVSRELVLAGFLAPVAIAGTQTRAALTLEVLYPGAPAVPAKLSDDLQLQIIDASAEGAARVLATRGFHFGMTATRPGDVAFLVNALVDLPSGVNNLRIGLLSTATGRVGTLALPVRVPDLTSTALQIASVVVGVDAAPEPAMPPDALRAFVPFQPLLRRSFSSAETLHVFAPLSWGDASPAAAVTVTLSGAATPTKVTVQGAAGTTGVRRGNLDVQVPLSGLAPGEHVLTVEARVGTLSAVSKTVGFRVGPR
jgi:VWFA-related protein